MPDNSSISVLSSDKDSLNKAGALFIDYLTSVRRLSLHTIAPIRLTLITFIGIANLQIVKRLAALIVNGFVSTPPNCIAKA